MIIVGSRLNETSSSSVPLWCNVLVPVEAVIGVTGIIAAVLITIKISSKVFVVACIVIMHTIIIDLISAVIIWSVKEEAKDLVHTVILLWIQ